MKLGRAGWLAFNQEKALVGAFSVIVKTGCVTDGLFYSTTHNSVYLLHVVSFDLVLLLGEQESFENIGLRSSPI